MHLHATCTEKWKCISFIYFHQAHNHHEQSSGIRTRNKDISKKEREKSNKGQCYCSSNTHKEITSLVDMSDSQFMRLLSIASLDQVPLRLSCQRCLLALVSLHHLRIGCLHSAPTKFPHPVREKYSNWTDHQTQVSILLFVNAIRTLLL